MNRRVVTSRPPMSSAAMILAGIFACAPLEAQFTWNSGDILTVLNPPTVEVGETLDIATTGLHDFNAKTITNNGTVNWLAGALRSGGGGSIANNALFTDSASSEMNNDYTGGWAFNNASTGTYLKTAGTTTVLAGVAFNNQGLVEVTGGTLTLQGGGNLAGGTLRASSGATINLAGSFSANGTVTLEGLGDIRLTAGTFSGTTTFGGTLNWVAGNFNGVGTTTFGSAATLLITSINLHDFSQRALVNAGVVHWTAGALRSGGGGSFTNHAVFNDANAANNEINNDYTGGATFTNSATGVFNKTGAGTTFFRSGVGLVNAGQMNIDAGTLRLEGSGNLAGGTITAAAGAVVDLASSFNSPGTVTFAGAGDIRFTAGTFSGLTTLEGPLNWVSGNFNGTGTTTFGTSAVISVTGANLHDFNARHLVNNGTVNWTAGKLRSGGGGSFTNNHLFTANGGVELNNDYTGGWTFINPASGVFTKSGAGTTSFLAGVGLTNTGLVTVTGGTLVLGGGGNLAGGTLSAAANTVIDLASSFNNPGTVTFAGAGDIRFTTGTMFGTTTFEGPLNWVAGNFNGAGTTTFGVSSVVTASGANLHDFNQRHLVSRGVFNWTGGELRSGGGGSFTNEATFNASAGVELNNDYTGGWTFINAATGVFTKSGAGTTTFGPGVSVQNLGLINVTGGMLVLSGGGNLSGGTIRAASGLSVLLASSFNNPGTVTFAGEGNVMFTAGTMTGTTTFEGPLTWTAGNFNGSGTTTFGSTARVNLTTTGPHDFNQRALVNFGEFSWFDGAIRAGGGASFTNRGKFQDFSLSNQFNNDYTGGWTFTNETDGTYLKSGTGTTTVGAGVGFVNKGTLHLKHGTLQMNTTLSLQSTSDLVYTLSGSATDSGYGLLSVSTALALNGTLNLRFGSGFDTAATFGQTFTLLNSGDLSGSFLNVANGGRLVSTDGLGSFSVHYGAGSAFGANSVVLTGFISVPEPSTWALLLLGGGAVALGLRRRRT